MFQCVVCKNNVAEKNRIFEGLDWCPSCISKDGKILTRESKNIPSSMLPNMPPPLARYESQKAKFFVTRPPYYAIYKNQVPDAIKRKIVKG